jgi:hypothetical protein
MMMSEPWAEDGKGRENKDLTRGSTTQVACFLAPTVRNWGHTFMAFMVFCLDLRYPILLAFAFGL